MPSCKFRHVIWDWNGTILNDMPVCLRVLNTVLAENGLPQIDRDTYLKGFGFPVRQFYEQLGFDFTRLSYQQVADRYIRLYRVLQSECPLQAGARDVLDWCRKAGLTQSVLSAYNQYLLERAIADRGLTGYFVKVAGNADHLASGKLAQGRHLVDQIGPPVGQIVLIGDTTHDYQVAAALGVACILVGIGHQDPARLRTCPVPVVGSLSDLPGLLSG